jgi:spore maturation protein CgeB
MRVGVIGPLKDDDFAENIAVALDDMGIDNVRLGPAIPTVTGKASRFAVETAQQVAPGLKDRMQRDLVRRALAAECDVIISVDSRLSVSTVDALRRGGAQTVLWFPDAIPNMGNLGMLMCRYDRYYLKDPVLCERLTNVYGAPAHYLPEACNPRWHRPTGSAGVEPFVAVVGNLYPSRLLLLDRLMAAGVPLRLYGGRAPRGSGGFASAGLDVLPAVFREDKARVFHEARAVLNNLHPGEMSGVNCRLFESAASGAVTLCEDRPALAGLFEPGREVLAFQSFDELLGQIDSALTSPDHQQPLRDAATRRAHAEHSYAARLTRILEDLS